MYSRGNTEIKLLLLYYLSMVLLTSNIYGRFNVTVLLDGQKLNLYYKQFDVRGGRLKSMLRTLFSF